MFKKSLYVILLVAAVAMVSSQAMAIQDAPHAQMLTPYDDPSGPQRPNCEYYSWRIPPCLTQPMESKVVLDGVNFDFDKSSLRPESYAILDGNVTKLKSNSKKVTVEGHTDSIGTDAYNQKLSERRAQTVYNYFTSKGIGAARLTAVGKGEASPVADNKTDEGRFKNRRVELHVH
ncbi:MAG: OmpA family protein [Deltaproteobacteria bacterium]|nr:OmpA family protein [Deltaproteobacteria bacterium]